ncbi:MAG: hypothetical protein L7U49_06060 [Litoricolaceae bacterium]|nr:hypothetical protein [Litorivicinaceae bacterium]
MTDIDKERLKSFLNDFACEAPAELEKRHDTLIDQLYVYAYGKNFMKQPFPKILEDGSFYAGPHLLTEDEKKWAAQYFKHRNDGCKHTDAIEKAAKTLDKSDKSIEAAQTKFRKRQALINQLKKEQST